MEVTPALLSVFPLLKPLPPSSLAHLLTCSHVKKFSRREVVLDPRSNDNSICLVFQGKLQAIDFTLDGKEVGLYFVEPKDFCGEILLFDELAGTELIIALTPSVVVKIPDTEIRKLMREAPSVMNEVGKKLAARIKQLTSQRALLAISNVQQRVCCQIWMLCVEASGEKVTLFGHEAEILNPPTHLEIANMLSVSRESVTRVFQTLQNRQIVRRNGPNSLIISAPNKLRELAEGA